MLKGTVFNTDFVTSTQNFNFARENQSKKSGHAFTAVQGFFSFSLVFGSIEGIRLTTTKNKIKTKKQKNKKTKKQKNKKTKKTTGMGWVSRVETATVAHK